jgi:hypothetical protein
LFELNKLYILLSSLRLKSFTKICNWEIIKSNKEFLSELLFSDKFGDKIDFNEVYEFRRISNFEVCKVLDN